jgi:hypothetical protein
MYGTSIIKFEGGSLTLESTRDPSGMRTYIHSERCPNENNVGWALAGVGAASDPTKHDPALAIDSHGHVHALLGSVGGAQYTFLGDGCRPIAEPAFAGRTEAIALPGDEVHILFETINDGSVIHQWRTSPAAPWQTETVLPATTSTFLNDLELLVDGADLIAVASRTDGTLIISRRDASGWNIVPVVVPDPQRPIEDATLGLNGDIAMWAGDRVRIIRGTAVEDILVTPGGGQTGTLRVDAQGRIHAAWENVQLASSSLSVYGIYDGAWTVHPLGPLSFPHVVTTPAGPMRVIGSELRNDTLTLVEIADDGKLTSELLLDGGVTSGIYNAGMKVDAVAAPDGTIAASFSSRFAQVRWPERRRPARTATMTLKFFLGMGRVYSDDGLIDCSADCTKEVPLGKRAALKVEPAIAGYQGNVSTCMDRGDGWCWQDLVGPTPLKPIELSAAFIPP